MSTKPKNKNSKFGKNNVFYDTKPDISNELLVVPDKKSKIPYFFDTGSKNSTIPKAVINTFKEDKLRPEISAVRGNKMKALGYTTLNVNIGLQQESPQKFYITESSNHFATLGLDFIVEKNLTINAKEKMITQAETGVKLKLEFSNPFIKKAIKKEKKKHLDFFSRNRKSIKLQRKS